MHKIKKITLGLGEKDRSSSTNLLDRVFCSLTLALEANMKLYWQSSGSRPGDLYKQKLDMTWNQINRLGVRITQLGGNPTLASNKQLQKTWIEYSPDLVGFGLMFEDLECEDKLCGHIRESLSIMQRGQDWGSIKLLGEVLVQREEFIHQLETVFEYEPVLEHVWDTEEISMDQEKGKEKNPQMH